MSLLLVGLNHRTAPVEMRERLSVATGEAEKLLSTVRSLPPVEGAAVLSTCNRVELSLSVSSEDVLDPVVGMLTERAAIGRAELERHLYVLRGSDVVRHLFRVAAGLDSMIIGEPQIGGQVREAYQKARESAMLDPLLQRLFEETLRVAKKVRTDTGIGEHAVSVPFAAVELARKIFGELEGLQVLLVGAGEMGELTAEHLAGYGTRKVFVANRAWERAEELAKRFTGTAVKFDSLTEYLETSDIVIVSTSAPHFVVTSEQVRAASATRRRRDLFLIDLSVPRNIDPAAAEIEGAYLYDIDDLQGVADANMAKRMAKSEEAEAIVDREVALFLRRIASSEAVPTILELQGRLETIRRDELEKCLRRLGPISAEQRAAVEMLTTQMVNKIIHYPILRLKESAADERASEGARVRDTIRRIFGLG